MKTRKSKQRRIPVSAWLDRPFEQPTSRGLSPTAQSAQTGEAGSDDGQNLRRDVPHGNPAAGRFATYQSQLRTIAELAANGRTGGAVFSLQIHGGRFLVGAITDPMDTHVPKWRRRTLQRRLKRSARRILKEAMDGLRQAARWIQRHKTNHTSLKQEPHPVAAMMAPGAEVDWITMHESELQAMAHLAMKYPDLETGGTVHGLLGHRGHLVVGLVTGPGPQASHHRCAYRLDHQAVRRNHRLLFAIFGQQLIATWHHHHLLGLFTPSTTDDDQAQAFLRDNQLSRYCSIITNIESHGGASRIHIHVYRYGSGDNHRVPLKIRVLPGVSPIRESAVRQGLLSASECGRADFPMSRIVFDRYEEPDSTGDTVGNLAELGRQISMLPQELQSELTLSPREGSIVIQLSLAGGAAATVVVDDSEPHAVRAVRWMSDADVFNQDITDEVLDPGSTATLADVCVKLVQRTVGRGYSGEVAQTTERSASTAEAEFSHDISR